MPDKLIIIFSRSPIPGRVKTRLAKDIGHEQALQVHNKLFDLTRAVVERTGFEKKLYLSSPAPRDFGYKYQLQQGDNLGDRMGHALHKELVKYKMVVLIGSDCLDLTDEDLTKAFEVLENNDLVLGPAADGGYYLIGMRQYHPELFRNITWSNKNVLQESLKIANQLNLKTFLLKTRSDVDTKEDLPANWNAS